MNRGAQLGKIELQDVKRAIDIGKDVLPFVKPAVDRFGPALIDWGQQKVKQAADGLGEARDSILSKGQAVKDEKERQKSLEAARKKAVASSLPPISAKEFFENFENSVSSEADLSDGYMAIAGCYAITTMKSDRRRDAGLLQHDLAEPDVVGAGVGAERQDALVLVEPFQQCRGDVFHLFCSPC